MNALRKTVALSIWWCEGAKPRRDHRWKNSILCPIEVTNSDPRIIKIFVDFLTLDMGISIQRIKGQLHIHDGDDQFEMEEYWSEKLGLPRSQFNKTIIRPKGHKIGKNKGTFKLRLYDKKLYKTLQKKLEIDLKSL